MQTLSVFIHHDHDEVTQRHWNRLCEFSSQRPISISATGKRLPGGHSIEDWPEDARSIQGHRKRHPSLAARSTDLLLLAWFRNRQVSADRYFVVEWDTLVNCDIERWLARIGDLPFTAPSIRLPNRDKNWYWFRHAPSLPKNIRPYSCGVVPFTCLCISHDAINAISENYPTKLGTGNGELRFATVAAKCGFPPVANPQAGQTLTWLKLEPVGLVEQIYHPIKHLMDEPRPWMTSREIEALETLLRPEHHVLEYGSGGSTFWLSKQVSKVTSIEHSAEWIKRMLPTPPNVNLVFEPPSWPHVSFEPAQPGQFDEYIVAPKHIEPDLVLVDGRARVSCAELWSSRCLTLIHNANRERYQSLTMKKIVGSLSQVLPST